jgi:predicted PurR-regulated permease PerM
VALLATIWLLRTAQEFFIPVILAILAAYALNPFVNGLMRCRVPRALASAVVVFVTLATLGLGAYALSDEATDAVQRLPKAAEKLKRDLRSLRSKPSPVGNLQEAAQQLEAAATEAAASRPTPGVAKVQVVEPPVNVQQYMFWGSMTLLAFAGQVLMMSFLLFFLLATATDLKRKVLGVSTKRQVIRSILDDINTRVEQFVRNVVIANTCVALLSWAFFRYAGMEHAALLGLLCGVLNAVPYVGAAAGVVVVALAAFVQFGAIGTATFVAAGAMLITGIEGYLLTPWLMRRSASINGPALFIGLLFWGWVWGAWGMLLAYPLMMVLKTVVDHVADFSAASELLSE